MEKAKRCFSFHLQLSYFMCEAYFHFEFVTLRFKIVAFSFNIRPFIISLFPEIGTPAKRYKPCNHVVRRSILLFWIFIVKVL